MKRERISEKNKRRIQTICTILLPAFFLLFIGAIVLLCLNYVYGGKINDFASPHTMNTKIERNGTLSGQNRTVSGQYWSKYQI